MTAKTTSKNSEAAQNKDIGRKGAVSLTDTAIDHFKSVLADADATDTAKSNAANGLASIDRQRGKQMAGVIHRLSRAELTQEIDRMRAIMADLG